MIKKLTIAAMVAAFGITGCVTLPVDQVSAESYLGYQPMDPVPASKVTIYDRTSNSEKEIFWESIPDAESKRPLLPLQSAQISISKSDVSGKISYLVSSVSAEKGSYEVIMDYMKYRVEDVWDTSGEYLGSGRVGVGLRIKARVVTNKANLNLGSIGGIGLAASQGNLTGGVSVDVVGIDSPDVTNLIPLTSEINQTSIQSALQALASIKAKLWEDDTKITPHLVAIRQAKKETGAKIRFQVSTFVKTSSGDLLRRYWKPDGKSIVAVNENKLKTWMADNALDVSAGSITMFLRDSDFEDLRKKAVRDLKLK